MRLVLCAALVAAACAPADKSRAPAAGPAQKYAGTWDGRAYHSESDTGTPYRIVSSVAEDGSLRGTLMFQDRKSTRLNSSHSQISYAVFCLKKKNKNYQLRHVRHENRQHLSA